MIKRILTIVLIFSALNFYAQEDSPWAVGVYTTPFYLGKINNGQNENIDADGLSGGYNIGFSIKRYLNGSLNIESGISYSTLWYNGKQKGAVPEGSDLYYDFEYTKFPLKINFVKLWNYSKDLYLTLGIGGQVMCLNNYRVTIEDRLQKIVYEKGERFLYIKSNGYRNTLKRDVFAKRIFGIIGSLGIKKRFSSRFSYSFQLGAEYDLSNFYQNYYQKYKTHFFRIGIQFGLEYRFNLFPSPHVQGIL